MPFDWSCGPLAEGLHCYRTGQFFEAHEHWEAVWLAAPEPEKTFLQAIIQVAAAFHHLNSGNRTGAISLLGRALRRLEAYPAQFGGVDLARLRPELQAWLAALSANNRPGQLPSYPKIV